MTIRGWNGRGLLRIGFAVRLRLPTKFLDRAESDAVSLAESPIDGAGLCHAHFSAPNQRGYVVRIGIAITNEAA